MNTCDWRALMERQAKLTDAQKLQLIAAALRRSGLGNAGLDVRFAFGVDPWGCGWGEKPLADAVASYLDSLAERLGHQRVDGSLGSQHGARCLI